MKQLLCFFFITTSFFCNAQKILFPAKNFSDSNNYEQTITRLASEVIPLYSNKEKADYYNDMFRLYFAKQDHKAVIQSLDSFDVNAKLDKIFYRVSGFHYRIHSMSMLAMNGSTSKDYNKEYATIFTNLFQSLPDEGKDQVRTVYNEANTELEKQEFVKEVKDYGQTGSDNMDIATALQLIKQFNYWQVYEKTVALAKKQLAIIDAADAAKQQNKLTGLEEGATLLPNTKTFITHVTMLDVEKQKIVSNATVGITGSNITSISTSSKATLPPDATIIDGTGKFLLPGLTDAHVHFSQSGGLYTRPDAIDLRKDMPYDKEIEWTHVNMKDVLKRYLQAGITNVIDVGSTVNFLKQRDQFKGKSYAPSIYMTGPLITSYEPTAFKNLGDNDPFSLVATEEDGRKMVQQQLPYHPDFIKIWYIVANSTDKEAAAKKFLPVAKAIIDEAHKNNLKVAVHATERITAQLAVEAGCDYLVHSVDDEILSDDFVKLLKTKNITLCPTLVVHDGYNKTFGQELEFSSRELRLSDPQQLGSLYDMKHLPEKPMIDAYKKSIRNSKASSNKLDSICAVNLKKLVDADVRIAAGTDAGNIGTLHATSYLNELIAMKKAGLTNWQVLKSATINPTYILGKEKQTGSIAIGKMADMILLNANPVDNLQNLEQIKLVINKGFIIRPDTLIKETNIALINRQLNAYNAHNLEAFLETYAEDIELYDFPAKLVCKGKEDMRKQYDFIKSVPELHCEIKERIVQGNTIIDKESVSGFGSKAIEATAVYQIENGKIRSVYFISK
ncbi:MAG: amidohydrolase family protein [Ferruginibacter sp.]